MFCKNDNNLSGTNVLPAKKRKKGVAVRSISAVLAALLLSACGSPSDSGSSSSASAQQSAEKALKACLEAGVDGDAKTYVDIAYSPYSELEKEEKEDLIQDLQENLEDAKKDREIDDIKVSYKNIQTTKEYEKNEVKKIAEYLNENYKYDTDTYKLEEVSVLRYTVITEEDGDEDTDTEETVMIKVEGKWYVVNGLSKDMIKNILKKS